MSEIKETSSLAELTQPCDPSSDPNYLVWKEAKIRKGLEQSKDRSNMIPAHKVWETFGFER
ncbi:hypothetical protein [Pararhizobium sp. IMCC21322]|uniref:hypothetical protein n=1 Tax=Pararhizobium sp. IMCC21322 TaxID=3067903 RepID=UPI00274251BB|nr:hypothetical protein [Pararhizobium sp. IMCC21322]